MSFRSTLTSLLQDKKPTRRRQLSKEDVLLAKQIAKFRKARGLTQEELSDILAMNPLYITMVENKQQGLSLPMVYRIARAFPNPGEWVFGRVK
jgi:transcriptional regulator with XRE-family HTH domain